MSEGKFSYDELYQMPINKLQLMGIFLQKQLEEDKKEVDKHKARK